MTTKLRDRKFPAKGGSYNVDGELVKKPTAPGLTSTEARAKAAKDAKAEAAKAKRAAAAKAAKQPKKATGGTK